MTGVWVAVAIMVLGGMVAVFSYPRAVSLTRPDYRGWQKVFAFGASIAFVYSGFIVLLLILAIIGLI